jgi:hypothetical protein
MRRDVSDAGAFECVQCFIHSGLHDDSTVLSLECHNFSMAKCGAADPHALSRASSFAPATQPWKNMNLLPQRCPRHVVQHSVRNNYDFLHLRQKIRHDWTARPQREFGCTDQFCRITHDA